MDETQERSEGDRGSPKEGSHKEGSNTLQATKERKLAKIERAIAKRDHMIVGTAHFRTFGAACRYYAPYGFTEGDVHERVQNQTVYIGKPELKDGETLTLIDHGCRWAIIVPASTSREAGNPGE